MKKADIDKLAGSVERILNIAESVKDKLKDKKVTWGEAIDFVLNDSKDVLYVIRHLAEIVEELEALDNYGVRTLYYTVADRLEITDPVKKEGIGHIIQAAISTKLALQVLLK